MSCIEEVDALVATRTRILERLYEEREAIVVRLCKIDDAILALGGIPRGMRGGTIVQSIIDFVGRRPGCSSTEIGLAVGGHSRATAAATLAVTGRLRRRKENGLWRYYVPDQFEAGL